MVSFNIFDWLNHYEEAKRLQEILTTFLAWRPFGPSTTSKLTRSPSLRVLNPSAMMEASWTKTSAPRSRTMKPKPLPSLNHFTVPCSAILLLLATNETGLLFLPPGSLGWSLDGRQEKNEGAYPIGDSTLVATLLAIKGPLHVKPEDRGARFDRSIQIELELNFVDVLPEADRAAASSLQKLILAYSQILGETIFFCEDEDTKAALIEAGASEWSIYTRDELRILCEQNRIKQFTQAELRKLQEIQTDPWRKNCQMTFCAFIG